MSKKQKIIIRISIIMSSSIVLTAILQVITDFVVIQTVFGKIISSALFFITCIFACADFVYIIDKSEGRVYERYHKVSCKRYLYLVALFFTANIIICEVIQQEYGMIEVQGIAFLLILVETCRWWREVGKTY